MRNLLIIALMLFGVTLSAQTKNKNARHDIAVAGNCEMCKKRIEKAAFSVSGVKSAQWHADDQTLHIILNEEKSSTKQVAEAVAKSGHDAGEIKASDKDYQALHGCCKYDRKQE